jgi:putative endonuclease
MRTLRQRRGAQAEDLAVAWLEEHGWQVLARNVKVDNRDEIDIVAVDPGPPAELVCVEVRSARSSAFGTPEERVDYRKVGHLYRAARVFNRSPAAQQLAVGAMSVRVDLVVVDLRGRRPLIRHLARLEPA